MTLSSFKKITNKFVVLSLAIITLLGNNGLVKALNNGLGLTPPMGWNTWNKYYCNIN
jgi:alpha-galactosidase